MAGTVRSYCEDCDNDTNHAIVYSKTVKRSYPEIIDEDEMDVEDVKEKSTYNIVQCKGCNAYSFLKTISYSNDVDHNDKPIVYLFPYPDPGDFEDESENTMFLRNIEVKALPPLVRNLYIEVTEAFKNRLDILAGMGLRSLLEALCLQRNIPGRNLMQKIENLHQEGYISRKEMPILQKLREMGNTTVHEVKKPTQKILYSALEIINHTLKTVYYMHKMENKISRR